MRCASPGWGKVHMYWIHTPATHRGVRVETVVPVCRVTRRGAPPGQGTLSALLMPPASRHHLLPIVPPTRCPTGEDPCTTRRFRSGAQASSWCPDSKVIPVPLGQPRTTSSQDVRPRPSGAVCALRSTGPRETSSGTPYNMLAAPHRVVETIHPPKLQPCVAVG